MFLTTLLHKKRAFLTSLISNVNTESSSVLISFSFRSLHDPQRIEVNDDLQPSERNDCGHSTIYPEN
jgi:hypothetical protein